MEFQNLFFNNVGDCIIINTGLIFCEEAWGAIIVPPLFTIDYLERELSGIFSQMRIGLDHLLNPCHIDTILHESVIILRRVVMPSVHENDRNSDLIYVIGKLDRLDSLGQQGRLQLPTHHTIQLQGNLKHLLESCHMPTDSREIRHQEIQVAGSAPLNDEGIPEGPFLVTRLFPIDLSPLRFERIKSDELKLIADPLN